MERYINFLIFLLLAVLIGFNTSLTFVITPLIFSHFNARLAGEIVSVIFPYYFASGWIIGIAIYTLIAIISLKDKNIVKKLKGFIIGLSILIISFMALHKTVLPIAQSLKNSYYMLIDKGEKEKAKIVYDKFKTVHMISSSLNLFNLILELYLFYYMYAYVNRKEE